MRPELIPAAVNHGKSMARGEARTCSRAGAANLHHHKNELRAPHVFAETCLISLQGLISDQCLLCYWNYS